MDEVDGFGAGLGTQPDLGQKLGSPLLVFADDSRERIDKLFPFPAEGRFENREK